MQSIVDDASGRARFIAELLLVAASSAVLLSVVGLYGVIAYAVSQRTHEIGVRLALGANGGDLIRMLVTQSLQSVVISVTLGIAFVFAAGRWLASITFEISAYDPRTIVTMALLLLVFASCTSYLASRRATRVDPLTALQTE